MIFSCISPRSFRRVIATAWARRVTFVARLFCSPHPPIEEVSGWQKRRTCLRAYLLQLVAAARLSAAEILRLGAPFFRRCSPPSFSPIALLSRAYTIVCLRPHWNCRCTDPLVICFRSQIIFLCYCASYSALLKG